MKSKLLIILAIGAFVIAALFIMKKLTPKEVVVVKPSPTPYSLPTVNNWNGVVPGVSTMQDATTKMGLPISTQTNGSQQTILYHSNNPYWNNEITSNNQTITFIREYVFPPDEVSYKKLSVNIYIKPTVLYNSDYSGGLVLYTYPSLGLAYKTNVESNTVYEIWRFAPTSLQDFLSLPQASGYSTQPVANPE